MPRSTAGLSGKWSADRLARQLFTRMFDRILGPDLKLPKLEKQERGLVEKSEGEIVLPESELTTSAG